METSICSLVHIILTDLYFSASVQSNLPMNKWQHPKNSVSYLIQTELAAIFNLSPGFCSIEKGKNYSAVPMMQRCLESNKNLDLDF